METTEPLRDVRDRQDVDALLRDFYSQVFDDELLRHVFVDVVAMDLEEHLPVMGDFWEKVLFNTCEYRGNAMRVHRGINALEPLRPALFARWLTLWDRTLERRHRGPVAAAAARHAVRIAAAMQRNFAPAAGPTAVPAPRERSMS